MKKNKIMPSLWFCSESGNISKIIDYYKKVFGGEFKEGKIMSLGHTPSGNTEICEVILYGQKYSFMCTEVEHNPFNDALSLTIYCENQDEIDKLWNYFTKDGEESQCGWCFDKFGLRWQVLPANFGELMSKPNSFEVMMTQRKIVIAEYLK
jgi:predicted 3-demethylubiquinone-9 3-methyltransferase (glyoxalase superfamily)